MNEFAIIREYFASRSGQRPDVVVGIGDDAAVIAPEPGFNIVCTTDLLLENVHFPRGTDARAVGHKSLAVNLSDLAAMGAAPAWVTLLLSLPSNDAAWVEAFSAGFHDLAAEHGVQLVGGDLVRGPLAVGVQAMGYAEPGSTLLRSGARAGDDVYVSGSLGDAFAGLQARQGKLTLSPPQREYAVGRLDYPTPRVALGRRLVRVARAAIDLSDGLLGDLGHIVSASKVAARIDVRRLPISSVYRDRLSTLGWDGALCGGDDYELCFTAPPAMERRIAGIATELALPISKIGRIEAGSGVRVLQDGRPYVAAARAYDHFA